MQDVLVLRDFIWLIRHLGWVCLFFLYLSRLKPRAVGPLMQGLCFLFLFLLSVAIQYQARITLIHDTVFNGAGWMSVCLLLKKNHWRDALYGALAFGIISDLSKIISHDLLYCFLLQPRLTALPLILVHLVYSLLNLSVGLVCVLLFRGLIFQSDKQLYSRTHMILILLPSLVYFYARNFQFILLNSTPYLAAGYLMQAYVLLLLLGFCALLISILTDNSLAARLSEEELRHMQALIARQHQEFASQKSASEAIRQKYHDLKNCLLALKAENVSAAPLRRRFMEEIDQIMKPLEAGVETGNEFLNIVLADKIRLCQERQIRLTPYADGRCLHFIDGLDLCVIVGNALDNAIEAVETLPANKREIHLKISRCNDMALLCFHNYYSGRLKRNAAGFYQTSKPDTGNHGYGLRGISQTVDKYDGTLAVEATDHEFTLNILIPVLPETKPDRSDRY